MKVMLATPAYRGISYAPFVEALDATVKLFATAGIESVVQLVTGCCYVQVARNQIVKRFQQSNCDKLLFLDDDVSWRAEDALSLVQSSYSVAAGVYRLKQDKEDYPVVLHCNDEGYPLATADGWLVASRVPGGFLCVEREVFSALEGAYPLYRYSDPVERGSTETETYFDFFPQGVFNGQWVGEDFAFCALWEAIGGQIRVNPGFSLTHHAGALAFTGNLKNWLLRQPGGVLYEKG